MVGKHELNIKLKDFFRNIENYENKLNNEIDRRISKIITKMKDPLIFFDVGSGKGKFTEKLLKLRSSSVYHLFEPVKDFYSILSKKFKDNTNVFINNFSLSNCNDRKIIYKSYTNSNFCINTYVKDLNLNDVVNEETITITLDQYCKYNMIKHIDFIKIDTDGYEAQVLEGFIRTLRNLDIKPYILIKLKWGSNHPNWHYCKNIFNEIMELDYFKTSFDKVKNESYVLLEPMK